MQALRKVWLYFGPTDAYFRIPAADAEPVLDTGPIRNYPLDVTARLTDGHFSHFDAQGLPVRIDAQSGRPIHNYTTLSSFAFANWDMYLRTADEKYRAAFLRAADYMVETVDRSDSSSARLRAELPGRGHVGAVSAMVQGEALSVLCRAAQLTQRAEYLEIAERSLSTFSQSVENDGVVGYIKTGPTSTAWYEEITDRPLNHVLNGMIFALWGLHDFWRLTDSETAKNLFERGARSVETALPLFDSGFWSWYSTPDTAVPPYIASMLYHSLHISQLTVLAAQIHSELVGSYARKFENYTRSPLNRFKAATTIARSKVRREDALDAAARVERRA